MSRKDQYITKRQLKAITSHGKHHSSTITGNAIGIFPELPDIQLLKRRKHAGEPKPPAHEMVENMTISIDLDVRDILDDKDLIQKLKHLLGIERIEKDFEVLSSADKIIRALAKAKFKNVSTIELDDEIIYHDPQNYFDTDEAINHIIGKIHTLHKRGNRIDMELLSQEHKECTVNVKVSRIHLPWMHDILIKFHGLLPEEYFRRIINYLEENLKIEEIEKEWKNV